MQRSRVRVVIFLLCALVLLLLPRNGLAALGDIVTVAGGGVGDGSAATAGCLNNPTGVAVDSAGNLYIADQNNHRIRKVAAGTGAITTVAGTGSAGSSGDNGAATAASLNYPTGVTVDSAGNLYIADYYNHRIRKVAAGTGTITTVAGNGSAFFSGDDGAATAASLNSPSAVTVDSAGNLYIADQDNQRIRKVAAGTGTITTVAGTGSAGFSGDDVAATATKLNYPNGVTVDSDGNLYIADYNNQRIRKVAAGTGTINTVAGTGSAGFSGDNVAATATKLNYPNGVTVDSDGNLYIADQDNHRIRKVAAGTGTITTVAGNGDDDFFGDNGAATEAGLNSPSGVTVDSARNLYIADQDNQRIRKVAAGAGTITTVAGNGSYAFAGDDGPATAARLNYPGGVAVDSAANLYIADQSNQRIRKVAAGTGTITTVAGNGSAGFSGDNGAATEAGLNSPSGVSVDSAGNLYIADYSNHRIRKVAAGTGTITTVAGTGSAGFSGDNGAATAAKLNSPSGVSVDSAGNLYIADYSNHRIRKVAAGTGTITTVAGNEFAGFSGDNGAATAASLNYPTGVTVDSAGNLYIADYYNHRIRKVAAGTGTITTVAGTGTPGFSGDDVAATAASLNYPTGVTVDSDGNIYIADKNNQRIRKLAAGTGTITTLAGTGFYGFSGDNGAATAASLNYPRGVTVDSAGNLYIVDQNNQRIREVIASVTPVVTALPDGGTYPFAQAVTLTASKPATIYYTTDGSDPTTSATRQSLANSGEVIIWATTTLKYYAVDTEANAGSVTAQSYTIITPYYSLSVSFDGTGGGSVNSAPTGIACISGTCTANFASETEVTLIPLPDANSLFNGWSGGCTNTSGDCFVTMNADNAATATFTYVQPARLAGSPPDYYSGLQAAYGAAYNAAETDATIQARAFEFTENLLLSHNIAVAIEGGYDTSYATKSGVTALHGTLTVESGSLTVEQLEIY